MALASTILSYANVHCILGLSLFLERNYFRAFFIPSSLSLSLFFSLYGRERETENGSACAAVFGCVQCRGSAAATLHCHCIAWCNALLGRPLLLTLPFGLVGFLLAGQPLQRALCCALCAAMALHALGSGLVWLGLVRGPFAGRGMYLGMGLCHLVCKVQLEGSLKQGS